MGICIMFDNKEYVSGPNPSRGNLTRVYMFGSMFGGVHNYLLL